MPPVTDPVLRRQGLLFLRPELADKPATHVLLLGVGAYLHAPDGAEPLPGRADDLSQLTSPPISARRLANWFLTSFAHQRRPLGSLALLASPAEPGAVNARYADAVRPTAAATREAVRAWYDRVIGCTDNTAIFYACGHGSIVGPDLTVMLLEDCGADTRDDTVGTMNVDRLYRTMVNARVRQQLFLIDCCRAKDRDRADPVESEPAPLLSVRRRADDDGMRRLQAVIFATSSDEEARGRKNGTSALTDALLTALDGPALSMDSDPLMITTDRLAGTVQKLLQWRSRDGDAGQKSDNDKIDVFDLHQPSRPPETVATFVAMRTPQQWRECRVSVMADGVVLEASRAPEAKEPPVLRLDLPPRPLEFVVERAGKPSVRLQRRLNLPTHFARLDPDAPEMAATQVAGAVLRPSETVSAVSTTMAQLQMRLAIPVPTEIMRGAVARLRKLEADGRMGLAIKAIIPASGDETAGDKPTRIVDLPAGTWRATVTLPSGEALTETVAIAAGEAKSIVFESGQPPHEWLGWGHVAGLVPSHVRGDDAGTPDGPMPRIVPLDLSGPTAWNVPSHGADALEAMAVPAAAEALHRMIAERRRGYSFLYQPHAPTRGSADAASGLAFLPLGPTAPTIVLRLPEGGSWGRRLPLRVVARGDDRAPSSTPFVMVEELKLAPVLGHIARGALDEAAALLGDQRPEAVIAAAVRPGREDPLAAVVHAMIAVATASDGAPRPWDAPLIALQKGFAHIPDVSVVLARRLLRRANPDSDTARSLLAHAYENGLPVFSFALAWMAEDLALFADDDRDTQNCWQAVRRVLRQSVQQYPFTTLQLPP